MKMTHKSKTLHGRCSPFHTGILIDRYEVLIDIEDRSQAICGKELNELGMNGPRRNDNINSDVRREINNNFIELQDQLDQMLPNFVSEQAVFGESKFH